MLQKSTKTEVSFPMAMAHTHTQIYIILGDLASIDSLPVLVYLTYVKGMTSFSMNAAKSSFFSIEFIFRRCAFSFSHVNRASL